MIQAEPVSDLSLQWGEGPVWWQDRLWLVDIEGGTILRLDVDSGTPTRWEMDQRVGFALPASDGTWVWGGENGLYRLDPDTGASSWIADPEPDLPNNRFNDAAVSPDGRLFAGTIAMDRTPGAASLYRLDPPQTLTPVAGHLTNSNGIGWSPDGRTLYHIDTPTRRVNRYRYQDGNMSDRQVLVETGSVLDASPDGLCVDTEGHLWVAFCHGGCVIRFHGGTGEELDRIEVPAKETTSCCFGGPDLRDLYITTGQGEGERDSDGRVYVARGLEAPGLPQSAVSR